MIRRSDITVQSDGTTPQPGVYVTVKDADGYALNLYNDAGAALANPLLSGLDGSFYYNIADSDAGAITEEYRLSLLSSPRTIRVISLGLADSEGDLLVDDNGAVGDGTTDDTTSLQNTINTGAAQGRKVVFGSGTYVVTTLTIPSNVVIETAGFATTLRQKPFASSNVRILSIIGSNVRIGDISIEGNLGEVGDTLDEQNHAVFIQAKTATGNLSNIALGSIRAKNIRGDALYIGTVAGNGKSVANVTWGDITFDNIYRNGISICGAVHGWQGGSIRKDPAATYGCGLVEFDAESDPGSGVVEAGYLHSIYGKRALIAQTAAADFGRGIEFGEINLDPSRDSGSNPAYAPGAAYADYGFQYRNTAYAKIGTFIANGFNAQAIKNAYNGGELATQVLEIGYCKITDSCKTETTYNSYIQGASGVSVIRIGRLEATATKATHKIMDSFSFSSVGSAKITGFSTSIFISNCNDSTYSNISMTTGIMMSAGTRCSILGGVFNGDRVMNFCVDCTVSDLDATVTGSYDNSGTRCIFVNSTLGGTKYYLFQSAGQVRVDTSGNVVAGNSFIVGSNAVVKARKTGWATATGTATRTTFDTTTVTLPQLAERVKALIDDLHATAGHGLIGA